MGAVRGCSEVEAVRGKTAAYIVMRGVRVPSSGSSAAARSNGRIHQAAPRQSAAPDHPVPRLLLKELGEPLMSSTLLLASDPQPLTEGREIMARLGHEIDAVLDGGDCGIEPTTVVDLSVTPPLIVRQGKGDLGPITGRAL